ncbi:MAG TPA: ADOP family duplicated permease [Candidatus Acidoferrales bacterium]|nr:ADOP family duplicated permease [Candidatus Acidoferrales bacterium]
MLEARSLTKYYNHTLAVRQVSFTIRPGEILGYLGPNGAGKSTTVKMLTGLIEPSDGQIFFNGRSVYEDFTAFQRRIGYVPEEAHLYPHLSGREYLQLMGRLRGMEHQILEPKMDEFLRLLGLWNDRHAPLSSYSKGMRQKILLSAALLHDPDILILDEPFSGLDVTTALMLRSLLRGLAARGKMILYSSHVLEVVEKICSNVLILRKGEVVAYDSIDHLRELMSQPSLEGVFAQLAEVEDSDSLAGHVLDAMSSGAPRTPKPLADARGSESNARGSESDARGSEPSHNREGVGPANYAAEAWQDLRYGLRMLRRAPGFTAVALLSLTLGIGIATSAFSELNGFVLRDVPAVANPADLAGLQAPVSYPDFARYRDRSDLFSASLAYAAPVPFSVSLGARTERTWGHLVSPSYFSALGVRPVMGRAFEGLPEHAGLQEHAGQQEHLGQSPTVVVSYRFWQNQLGSDPSVIGKALRINGLPCTVIGVGPPDFQGASPMVFGADLWLPVWVEALAPELAGHVLERHDAAVFHMVGRLQPGVSMARAESELDAVARQLEVEYADPDRDQKGRRITLLPGGKLLPIRQQDLPLFTTFFIVLGGMILLIASSNVANMMLARSADRRREIAVRLALGAGRWRLMRQLLTESMLVAVASGVLGFLMAMVLMHVASQEKLPFPMPLHFQLEPDLRVLLFTLGLTAFTGLAFGFIPAWRATRTDLTPALKEGGNVQLRRFRRLSLRNALVLSQVAGSLALLLLTGFLVIGHQRMTGVEVGFDARRLYLISLDPVRDGYSPAQTARLFEKLLDRVKRLPSVTSASLADSTPMDMIGRPGVRFFVPGAQGTKAAFGARRFFVGRDFFDTIGIPVVLGRGFRKDDEVNGAHAVMVSEKLAQDCWKGQDPLGRRIEIGEEDLPRFIVAGASPGRSPRVSGKTEVFEVVGVAKNVRDGLDMVAKDAPAIIYLPMRPEEFARPARNGLTLIVRATPVRATGGVDALGAVRREISNIDPNITPFNGRSMIDQIDELMFPVKVALYTYGCIGIFGLILASVGLAGVTAYSVTQRRREIGIRVALGAQRGDVLGLVMKEGAVLVTLGTAAGLAAAWAAIRLMSAVMSQIARAAGTSTSDPWLLVGAPALLATLAMAACYVPARKSMNVDPAVTLRQE